MIEYETNTKPFSKERKKIFYLKRLKNYSNLKAWADWNDMPQKQPWEKNATSKNYIKCYRQTIKDDLIANFDFRYQNANLECVM